MYNVAIIGAGQLGSRHLQGLKGAAAPLSITVVDSSEDSLKVAKERYDVVQTIGEKEIKFTTDIKRLPSELDFVVVATSSKPRASIVKSLLTYSSVKNLILEKVLFPRLEDYNEIETLLQSKNVNCWVNCPRRMFGAYQIIKNSLISSKPLQMEYAGKDWGLCCNAMHFIDVFMYLTGEKSYVIDTNGIRPTILNSKRNGYIEMNGTLAISTSKGDTLKLISSETFDGSSYVDVKNGLNYFALDEQHGELTIQGKTMKVKIPYQSQMTGLLVDMVLNTGFCPLTPYKESADYHRVFIKEMLSVYNKIINLESDMLPIT